DLRSRHGGHRAHRARDQDRKSTRLNSSHDQISYAVFCLKKKKEARFSPLLSRPLVVSGELRYLGPGSLERIVQKPYSESAAIHGDAVTVRRGNAAPRHFSLEQAPQMRSLVASFSALLSGDVENLRSAFAL